MNIFERLKGVRARRADNGDEWKVTHLAIGPQPGDAVDDAGLPVAARVAFRQFLSQFGLRDHLADAIETFL